MHHALCGFCATTIWWSPNAPGLTELGSKTSKSAYIRRRVKLVAGKSVADALTVQVPDKDGAMGPYKKSDFKYDVKSGFLVF